ncbi:MAG: polyphosphate polymerase domain-containing protein [Mariprofundaceae bacterium]|nr:polyphosphate polymerase domain-containing protein [Mariprofundaceae bacterium]
MTGQLKSRFEYKFRISESACYRIRNVIRPYCRPDPHSVNSPSGRYLVRSLYYDTPDYAAYVDKVTGVYHRDKFRVRTYSTKAEPSLKLKIERKSRIGYLIHKAVATVTLEDYETFCRTKFLGDAKGKTLNDFSYDVFRIGLHPVLLVDYMREAFFSLDGGDVRFSFDHDVNYAWSSDLFKPLEPNKNCQQNSVIFENKSSRNDIDWLSRIVRVIGLESEPTVNIPMLLNILHGIFIFKEDRLLNSKIPTI